MKVAQAAQIAAAQGIEGREARLLAMKAATCSLEEFLRGEIELSPGGAFWLRQAVQRRLQGVPLQYILGEWEFYSLPFCVDERVLIPRPETELLVEKALELAEVRGYNTALDLCTGSGCIAVCLALKGLEVSAADVSGDALAVAKQNAQRHGVTAEFLQGDLFAPVGRRYDMIVSNPPYVSDDEMEGLQREVHFEPALALRAGDGYDFYRRIAAQSPQHLSRGGALLLEVGDGQAETVAALLTGAGFTDVVIYEDLAGIPRVIRGVRPE